MKHLSRILIAVLCASLFSACGASGQNVKTYGYKVEESVPHDVAAYMSYLWDIEEAFLEQNVILGHPRTVDATVDDPTLPTWTVTQLDLSAYSKQ